MTTKSVRTKIREVLMVFIRNLTEPQLSFSVNTYKVTMLAVKYCKLSIPVATLPEFELESDFKALSS